MQLEDAGSVMTDMVLYLGEPEGAEGPLCGTLEVSEDVFSAEDGARFVSSFTVRGLLPAHLYPSQPQVAQSLLHCFLNAALHRTTDPAGPLCIGNILCLVYLCQSGPYAASHPILHVMSEL